MDNETVEMAEEKRKKHKKRRKKALMIIFIPIAVLAAAFVLYTISLYLKYDAPSDKPDAPVYTTSVYQNVMKTSAVDTGKVYTKTEPVELALSRSGLETFEKYLSEYAVQYDFDEQYGIEEALKKYGNRAAEPIGKHAHDIRVNGKLDADHLYQLVKENNKKFFEESSSSNFYKEYSDNQLKEICRQMCEALEEISKKDPTVDLDTVCCYLYNIAIIAKTGSLDFGGFTMNNRFYLNYNMMESGGFAMDTDDIEKTTFYHEMMHAFQFACDDLKKGNEDRVGICYRDNDQKREPLFYNWLIEGSAEMNMSQYLGVRYSTYKNKISYVESVNFISNVGSGDERIRTEKLCFQRDANKLFEQLEVTEENEKKEIIKMMYSIELLQDSEDDFEDWYQKQYGVDFKSHEEERVKLRLLLKEDALLSMTKLFYRNLARRIHTGKASLQDAYYLMRLWESDLNRHIGDIIGYRVFFKEFYDNYLAIQNTFFALLCEENALDKTEVRKDFERYTVDTETKSPNCDLNFFSAERKGYYQYFRENCYNEKAPSILTCKKQTKQLIKEYAIDDYKASKLLID